MRSINPLLSSGLPVGDWLKRLERVSARLYETDVATWQVFEPVRKHLAQTASWLDSEGDISLSNTAAEAVTFLRAWNNEFFESWERAADAAVKALGRAQAASLLEQDLPSESRGTRRNTRNT